MATRQAWPGGPGGPGGKGTAPLPPTRAGIGLRQQHYAALLQGPPPELPFVEVHAENFFAAGGAAARLLRDARQRWPVSLHGVGLALGSAAGLCPWHLDRLAALVERIEPVRVSDHACFARAAVAGLQGEGGPFVVHAADLLPLAFNDASLAIMLRHVDAVQQRLRRPILVENIAAYLRFTDDTLAEPEFFNLLARRSGCGVLLDVNNLVVNALNALYAPYSPEGPTASHGGGDDVRAAATVREAHAVAAACRWIDALDRKSVGEIHLAGYHDAGELVFDDHGSRVRATVWQVFDHALAHVGPVPTLIEWDNDLPPLAVLLAQAQTAGDRLSACSRAGS